MAPKVLCRLIDEPDLPGIADLLPIGFPQRSRRYWKDGLRRLAGHVPPEGYPRFGHMLEADGRPVGVHLLICSGPLGAVRCNVSSWFVRDAFRSFGALLVLRSTRSLPGAYVNMQPRPETVPIIEAQGFRKYTQGVFAAAPLLARRSDAKLIDWRHEAIPEQDRKLLADHEAFGCISLWCDGPLILRRRHIRPGIPCAQLIYARSPEAVERAASAVGAYLARRGLMVLLVPSDRPLRLLGRHHPEKLPIYCRGKPVPAACDLSYTEGAAFGI